jgi:Mrp family chromosome partitioning ATPase
LNAPEPRQVVAQAPVADTSAWIAERDSAQSIVSQASSALSAARSKAKDYDQEIAQAHAEGNFDASPIALLAAALVFGIALGFGTAFVDEMRHPRVSEEHEVERMTGVRVLATVRPRPRLPDRDRRLADRNAPPYFDPGADGYQLTYLHVARAGASRVILTIAGDESGITTVIAINVAAIAADEARSTIIIDTDWRTSPVAAALRTPAGPGLLDVIDQGSDWAEVTSQVTLGRDRVINVLPSGTGAMRAPNQTTTQVVEFFRSEGPRIARHYEATVIVAPLEQAVSGLPGALPIRDTVVCARVGHTRIADLARALDRIRETNGNPLGIVLWDAAPPPPPRERTVAMSKPPRGAELNSATTLR